MHCVRPVVPDILGFGIGKGDIGRVFTENVLEVAN